MADLLPSQVLDAAAELIEPEGTWLIGGYARSAFDRTVRPVDDGAVCFCMVGAVARAAGLTISEVEAENYAPLGFVRSAIGTPHVHYWNDKHSQPAAVAALRHAAELARQEGR